MTTDRKVKYPYSRLKGLVEFMTFVKEPGWKPEIIDTSLFKKLGIAKGKEGEAVNALKFLGIIAADGTPTIEFDNLKRDYKTTMNRLLFEKYHDLFNLIPPKLTNPTRLINFFGPPAETAEYQSKLFIWFCEEAGIELPTVNKNIHRSRFDKNRPK
jgi:hypothetical protein